MDPRVMTCLESTFGSRGFRPGQAEACEAALAGRDVLVVMPTGAGKSLCYQLPAQLTPGLTVVVAPLIALMRDQVAQLRARGVAAGLLYAGQPPGESAAVLRAARQGQLRLLYLSPERLVAGSGLALLSQLPLARVVVDEAHCIVSWGRDFRPDYQALAPALARLGDPPVTALTATATSAEQAQILVALGRPRALRVVTGFDRPELYLAVRRARHAAERDAAILQACRAIGGPKLIYAATRGETERLATWLADTCGQLAAPYHAGLPTAARSAAQDSFLGNRLPILVATSAFGLGIDKADIRMVLFAGLPPDVSAFYQGIGRAGRDGRPAIGLLVTHAQDRALRAWQIDAATPRCMDLAAIVAALARPGGGDAPLAEAALAPLAGLELGLARAAAGLLGRAGILRRVGAGTWAALRAPRAGELAWLADQASSLAADRHAQLAQMVAYADASGCRRRRLLAHFGTQPARGRRVCCDRCGPPPAALRPARRAEPTASAALAVAGSSTSLDLVVLRCIGLRDGQLTLSGVSRVVREALLGWWPVPPDAVRAAAGHLIEGGLVAVHYREGAARLALTRAGRLRARETEASDPGKFGAGAVRALRRTGTGDREPV